MALAADGSVWLAAGAWLQQLDRQGRSLRQVWLGAGTTHRLLAQRDGTVWAATQGGLYRWRPGQTQPRLVQAEPVAEGSTPLVGQVAALAEAADGSLWVGAFHGLWRVAPGAERLQPVQGAPGAELANPQVIGLLFDRQQRLWLDTAVTGLHRMTQWDGRQARFDRISERLGRVGKPFGVNLLEDERGRIWTHMHVYDPAQDRIDELTAADGQNLGTGWFQAYAQSADGRLFFGGSRGLMVVKPADFEPATDVPPLVVSELRINGQRVHAAGLNGGSLQPAGLNGDRPRPAGLVLQPGQRSLSLELAALEYSDPARVRYAWQLQGFDSDWITVGADQRSAAYANLAPGDYVLRARASNRSGVWGERELVIPIQVLPTWWQHDATRVAAVLLAVLLGLAGMHARTRHLRAREQLLTQTVRERTARLEETTQALQRESAALKEASLTDPLTGLRNRRFLSEHIDADVAVSLRRWQDHLERGAPAPTTADLLLFLVDIDHFKQVNDLRGHDAGDAVIRQMRGRLQKVFRDTDYLVRWGGEEFLIVARGGSRAHAADLAERARQAVAGEAFVLPDGERLPCTCSLGFACFPLSTSAPAAVGWSVVASLADAALYRAKAHGRDAWAGVVEAGDLDEAEVAQRRPGPAWLADGSLRQQSSWELPPAPAA
jgi:diguanylate cyclase (GGDEF)-like protein